MMWYTICDTIRSHTHEGITEWRRCNGCLKLQVSFRKRATFTGLSCGIPYAIPYNTYNICLLRDTASIWYGVTYMVYHICHTVWDMASLWYDIPYAIPYDTNKISLQRNSDTISKGCLPCREIRHPFDMIYHMRYHTIPTISLCREIAILYPRDASSAERHGIPLIGCTICDTIFQQYLSAERSFSGKKPYNWWLFCRYTICDTNPCQQELFAER